MLSIEPEKTVLAALGRKEEADLVRSTLDSAGLLNHIHVANGDQALKVLEVTCPDVVLAAWELPGLGGLRLVKTVRGRYGSRPGCILVVPERPENEMAMAEGVEVTGFGIRPLTATTVVDRIGAALTAGDGPEAQAEQGDALLASGRNEAALAHYRSALEAGRQRLATFQTETGLLLMKMGRIAEAVDILTQAASTGPALARAQTALGQALLTAGRPEEASTVLDRAAALDPGNDETRQKLAESLLQSGQAAQATILFEDLLEKHPDDPMLLNRLAMALRREGRYAEAVVRYRQILARHGQDANLYHNLGRAYNEAGQITLARQALTKALGLDPSLAEARKLLETLTGVGGRK